MPGGKSLGGDSCADAEVTVCCLRCSLLAIQVYTLKRQGRERGQKSP